MTEKKKTEATLAAKAARLRKKLSGAGDMAAAKQRELRKRMKRAQRARRSLLAQAKRVADRKAKPAAAPAE